MDKQQSIITIIVMVVVVILSLVGAYFGANMGYQDKYNKLTKEYAQLLQDNKDITAKQDSGAFTPANLVKAFMNEVKSNNNGNAKLYLSADVQKTMDIKNTLKLGDDLSNITYGTFTETINGDGYKVAMDFVVGEDGAKRTFVLIKEDGLWKIKEIIAE